jgi:orotate phosphoribosyltransferase
MDTKELHYIFDKTGALQNGHFQLTSGLHSPVYFQCALVLQHPKYLEAFCREIVEFYREEEETIDVVIAPAVGGIVVAQEVGRQLGVRSIFAERQDGKITLRRGFLLSPRESVLILEDVVTTGGTVKEVAELVENAGAYVAGIACIVDRSGGNHKLEYPLFAVYSNKMITYKPESCPLCKQNKAIQKPGSRGL